MARTRRSESDSGLATDSSAEGDPVLIRRILINVRVPGNPKGCCGRNIARTQYRMAIFYPDGRVKITPQYESHLQMLNKHGPWEGNYTSIPQDMRDKIDAAFQKGEGDELS